MAEVLKLVALCGSLRTKSYNSALLRTVTEMAPPSVQITRLNFADFPVYDGDLEDRGFPPQVKAMQDAIQASDGLVIVTPEYNHGIPGGLKNALDWLSRGPMPHGLFAVPTALMGASDGSFGTTRCQYALRQTLTTLNAPTMQAPQILVTFSHKKFDDQMQLTDDITRKFMGDWLVAMEKWMRRFPKTER